MSTENANRNDQNEGEGPRQDNPMPPRREVGLGNIFIETYKAFPAPMMGREDIDLSNSIILPPSALQKLSSSEDFWDDKNRIFFRILNLDLNIKAFCGVFEFTAQEGLCYIPSHIFESLSLEEGLKVNVRKISLPLGTFIKLQPHKTEFINNPNPKVILLYNLRNYFCVTEGDTISVKFARKIYKVDVIECKPAKTVQILDYNIKIDLVSPKDYKEPERPVDKNNYSYIKFNSDENQAQLTQEEIQKQIIDKKFSGHHFTINGDDVTQNRRNKAYKVKKEKESEKDDYNPMKFRIPSNPRPDFKYVNLKFEMEI